jgi:hypothetical protein
MKKFILFGTLVMITSLTFVSFRSEKQLAIIEKADAVKELPAINNDAFKRGEMLAYRLHYGIIDAGVATLAITDETKEVAGRKTMHVVGLGSSKGAFDFFFKVRDRYETYIDEKALVPWVFLRHVDEGGYKFDQSYTFNHYSSKVNVDGKNEYVIEPNMQDMLSAFYNARALDLSSAKLGSVYSINCFMDREVWPLKIRFLGKENVSTDKGTFRCLKFCPIVQKGRIFKNDDDLKVWITDDKNHIIVKGEAAIIVGAVKVELTDYSGLANSVSKIN